MKYYLVICGDKTDQLYDLHDALDLAKHYLALGMTVEIVPVKECNAPKEFMSFPMAWS